jgi:hypothetical protein
VLTSSAVISQLHPDTFQWIGRATANGGTFTTSHIAILDRMISRIEALGVLSTFRAGVMLPIIGSNLAAALTPLYLPAGRSITNNLFVSGDYSEVAGLNPGAGNNTKYLGLGVTASEIITLTSARVGIAAQSNSGLSGFEVGARGSGVTVAFLFQCRNTLSQAVIQCFANTGAGFLASATNSVLSAIGYTVASRLSASDLRLFKGGAELANTATTGGSVPGSELYAFCFNNNGVAGSFSSRSISHIEVSRSISSTLEAGYYAIIAEKEAALGRST